MANITPTITRVPGQAGIDGWQVQWPTMHNGDVGLPVGSPIGDQAGSVLVPSGGSGFFSGFADKSIQVTGTFGVGGSVACEGSNDGTNYFALTDPSQTVIAITAAGGKAVTEAVAWVRPHVTAGDGTTAVTVTMFFRKTQQP